MMHVDISDEMRTGLSAALEKNGIFSGEIMVLARNENSDLIPVSKECSQEFFYALFSAEGPLWRTYASTRMGFAPTGAGYANFVCGRLYFCRNIEKRFMRSPGPEKSFAFRNGRLSEEKKLSARNALLLLGSPFDFLGHAMDIALLPLYVDGKMRGFSEFRKKAILDYEKFHTGEAGKRARDSMELAARAMEFSFVSSLALSMKTPIADSDIWTECEAERLRSLWEAGKKQEAVEEFGFHSESPYDISVPRLCENIDSLGRTAGVAPENRYARWRENCKFVCSRYLSIMRDAFLSVGEQSGLGNFVFHLRTDELEKAVQEPKKWKDVAKQRERALESFLKINVPNILVFDGKWNELKEMGTGIGGTPAGGPGEAEGPTVFIEDAGDYSKDVRGKVIVSRTFSPNLTTLFSEAKGVVSQSGGTLSHSAIIAREKGIPCIVQAGNLKRVREGQRIRMNGTTGEIRITD
ncbi:MAG: PEP-utilizing enzyme [Candidatus Micrarchaeota archaeon]